MLAVRWGQFIKTRFAVVGRYAPIRLDPALVLQALQRWVERTMVHEQNIV
jgi:hypothetical protein